MSDTLLEEQLRLFLRSLPPAQAEELARRYAEAAFAAGLNILRPDGTRVPIPPALTAAVEPDDTRHARAQLARHLLSGLVKAAAFLLGGAGRPEADAVFQGLSTRERELVQRTWRLGGRVAIARADLFTAPDGSDRPLEVNTTIPAMIGYSDIVDEAFIRAVGSARGLSAAALERLIGSNGSNVDELRGSLLAHARQLGVTMPAPRVAIVARPSDSQDGELDFMCQRFNASGLNAVRCVPADLRPGAAGAVLNDEPVDFVYCHVFVRRVEEELPFAAMLSEPERYRILNPPNSQLEVKALLADLSEAAAVSARAQAMELTAAEVTAALRTPWARRVRRGPSTDFDHEPIQDLLAFAGAKRDELVLKRSWSYGGTGVLLGDELETEAGQLRARELLGLTTGAAAISWGHLLGATADAGGFVLQRRIAPAAQAHLVATPRGPEWRNWFVDVSAFTNLGVEPHPSGAVRRGSTSRIVNIAGGGGLVPTIRQSVMRDLLSPS